MTTFKNVAPVNVSPYSTQPGTVFGANRQPPQQFQTVNVETRAPAMAAPVNINTSSNSHPFNSHRQMPVNTQVVRQRPIVVHTALPQTILIDQRSAVCPFVTLTPYAIAKKGNYLELSDGSVWKVRHRDRNKVKKWKASDAVIIETGKFFSWHAYSLVNYSRNETIDVELHLRDNLNGNTSHWIVEVNPYQGYVKLENGSVWRMSTAELAAWSQNDDVIIGLSRDWFSRHHNYVLINPKAKSRFTATFEF
ncbi:MAG: hypothetical protein H0U49_11585 [Parachlamydiaceae bacterium]|nr:hypothetical protein [Parachlamydiaceae bacterium]